MRLSLAQLNERQKEAVLHGDGPLLVLAGAGSGKTSTMAYRIAHLVAERRVSPLAVLGLSFTNKAAQELKERVKKLVQKAGGKSAGQGLTVSTFHSLCVRILRAHAPAAGLIPHFSIADESDQTDLLRDVLRRIKIDDRKFDLMSVRFAHGQAKNKFLEGDAAKEFLSTFPGFSIEYQLAAAASWDGYNAGLRARQCVDFDDLIFEAVKLLERNAEIRESYNKRFKYILVDEYQDTNPAQFRLLRALTQRQQNLCVVGDDDQSIYGWRGADASHILQFDRQFVGAKRVVLDQNYRSTPTILNAANQVIIQNTVRHPKKLWSDRADGEAIQEVIVEDDRAEGEWVAEAIAERGKRGESWDRFAVLFRSNAQARIFEEALRRHRVPYKVVGGPSFLDRKEIKDLIAYWKTALNPRDEAAVRRIINWPARGIGKSSLEGLNTLALDRQQALFEVLSQLTPGAFPKAEKGVADFLQAIRTSQQDLAQTPPEAGAVVQWGMRLLSRLKIKEGIAVDCPDDPAQAQRRWESVEELTQGLGQLTPEEVFEAADGQPVTAQLWVREYVSRLTLQGVDEREDEERPKGPEVTLLTLHGAKGLEFPVVYLVGCEEGYLPHHRVLKEATDLSEERRLCYVGITRAKDQLILTRAQNRIRYGKPVPRHPSRFLADIPADILVRQNLSSKPEHRSEAEKNAHEVRVKDFLSQIRSQITSK